MPALSIPVRLFIGSSSEGRDVAHNLQRLAAQHEVNRSKLFATALRLHLPAAPPGGV